jgi:hypothetical protein
MVAQAISKVLQLFQVGAVDLLQVPAALMLTVLQVAGILVTAVAQAVFQIHGLLAVAQAGILAVAQITENTHTLAVAGQAALNTHQLTELAQEEAPGYTGKDQAGKDFILRGAEITRQVVAETGAQVATLDTGVKTHGAVLVKAQITFKAEPTVAVVVARVLAGRHARVTDILALFEYCGELL